MHKEIEVEQKERGTECLMDNGRSNGRRLNKLI
jgi:hypothetical protein